MEACSAVTQCSETGIARSTWLLAAALLGLVGGCTGPDRRPDQPDANEPAATAPESQDPPTPYGPPAPPAETPTPRPEGWQGPEEPPGEGESEAFLDRLQMGLTGRARTSAAWIDGFLSDERSLAEDNSTWVRLRVDTFIEEDEGVDLTARLSGRLTLPQSEDRVQLVFSGDPDGDLDDEEAFDDEPTPVLEDEEDREVALGLQYFVEQTKRNNIRLELGARFDGITPDPYVGGRWRYLTTLITWTVRASERLRWYADTGLESKTTLDLERPLSETFFLRSSGRVNWYEEEDGLFYSTALRLYQRLGERELLVYEWTSSFETEPVERLKSTRVRLRWSRRVARDWILFELAPQITWREDDDYDPAAGLLVRLEFYFGRNPQEERAASGTGG